MNKYTIVILWFFLSFQLIAQNNQYQDSIANILENVSGTEQIDIIISILEERKLNEEEFILYTDEALLLCDEYNLPEKKAIVYIEVITYLHFMGSIEAQSKYIDPALEIAEQIKNPVFQNEIFRIVGMSHNRDGDFATAMHYLFRSLKIIEATAETEVTINTLMLIMISYHDQNKSDLVFEYGEKIFELAEDIDKEEIMSLLSYTYSVIGKAYFKQGDYQRSLEYSQKGIDLAQKYIGVISNMNLSLGLCYINAADASVKLNLFNKANLYYRSAKNLLTINGGTYGMNMVFNGLAEMYYEMGEIDSTIFYAKKAMDPTTRSAFVHREESLLLIANSYSKLGDYKEAFYYYQQYTIVKDSLLNLESEKQINELQTVYQTEKKEQQNKLLHLETEKQKSQLVAMIVAIISVLFILAFAIFSWYRTKKAKNTIEKQNNILKFQKEEIEIQKEEIITQSEELKYTNDQLVELASFKEGMTGMIVHDLKNPLSGIINISKSFSDKDKVQRMRLIGKQILNLVLNILDVHKYEVSKMTVEKQNCSLFEISSNAIEDVSFLAQQKDIEIINSISRQTGVNVDKDIVERIFVNILTNAIKYTPVNGKIVVGEETSTKFTRIKISDTGQGIPANQLHQIFEKFVQVQAVESGTVRSTGLGLTFCKMAIKSHGGEINVESVINKGTTFSFTLPVGELVIDQNTILYKKQNAVISFSLDDKLKLKPIILQLKEYEVYEVSSLRNVLNQIDAENNNEINLWKDEIIKAIRSGNEKRYIDLINLAS